MPAPNPYLTHLFQNAPHLAFDDQSKIILFSDCHRGDNSWADDFAHNQSLYYYALSHYLEEGFTYIEIGDGDELWENSDFTRIQRAHSDAFWLMRQFHVQKRLYLIWGNHDNARRRPATVQATLYEYYDTLHDRYEPLLDGIQVVEGMVLDHTPTQGQLFLAHGQQVDPFNYQWAWLSQFFVRHLWRHLQLIGVHDPTSPAQNVGKRVKIERRLAEWVQQTGKPLVAGHTHRPRFAGPHEPPYFNSGSCVHPRCITGLEIQNGELALVKWWLRPNEVGVLYVAQDILAGPRRLSAIFAATPPGGPSQARLVPSPPPATNQP